MSRTPPYPFLKWCGGKRRLVPHILARLPQKINIYYELLVGGGAVFIELAKQGRFKKAILYDTNLDVVIAWQTIKMHPLELIKALRKPKYKYDKQLYLKARAINPDRLSDTERAARFIYLNRVCFNGLYRENSKGKFNVPFGRYINPLICDATNIKAVSGLLENVDIMFNDFGDASYAKPGDAVYFDPPYLPTSNTSYFTAYTKAGFNMEDHRRLARTFKSLGDRGVRVVLTNSAADLTYELYDGFDMDVRRQNQSIGGPAAYRKDITEVIVFHGPKTM